MGTNQLIPHPERPPLAVTAITVRLDTRDPYWLRLRWRIEGTGKLVAPPFAGRTRREGLWRTTCFELFVRPAAAGERYAEFNLSPSEAWAAYDFAAYRQGMADRTMPRAPCCTMRPGRQFALFDAALPFASLPPLPWRAGLSAVIEEEGRHLSYWALAHLPGKPDFHDPACFALHVSAPKGES
jgi:hypothetical protein